MAMDLRQLSHLMAVADQGGFSAAARALHTVQSNVSTHVARLEKELGTVLVDRRTMQPTPEGQAVIERARRIGAEIQAISDDILSMRDEVGGLARSAALGPRPAGWPPPCWNGCVSPIRPSTPCSLTRVPKY